MQYRHEWKHRLSPLDLPVLRSRVGAVLKPDPHAVSGSYRIRSLYFDTPADTALREKLDGVSRREKFRIRCYDLDYSLIHLEKKSKRGRLSCKETADLNRDEVQRLLAGDLAWMASADRPLVRELYQKMRTQGLRPKTIVDYTREPFIFGPGNVRVTLDYNLRTGLRSTDFLDPNCVTIPAADDPILLEVKWDNYLPDLIRDIVQLEGRQSSAFSKYASCRIYE